MSKDFPYLHGFSETEQARLVKQARLAESTIFRNIDYAGARRLLEIGSGVGAQTEILLRRFPELHVTCVELSERQIEA
ncbi:class I SAM-dependent methyltransferase, partial [Acinetobacter baumannii]